MVVTGPLPVGVKIKPMLQVEPAMMVVPHVVELLSIGEVRVGRGEGSSEIQVVCAEVAEALLDDRRALADRDRAEGKRGIGIGDLADRAVAVIDDEEVAVAVDREADGVAHLRKAAKATIASFACGAGAENRGDVAAAAGGGGVDRIDAIRGRVGDVEIARSIDERGKTARSERCRSPGPGLWSLSCRCRRLHAGCPTCRLRRRGGRRRRRCRGCR